ncbi:hypothetical protein MKX96_16150 [Psychrobacillus sp. FSL W7-1493]|uniref:TcaA NTF2-like domain-containing protein n=1 Tax=Psychrobacillus sp. FSL W7-1493 TaxID=2921552 RepID=UPI0030FC21D6
MDRFCQECGHKIGNNDFACTNCGTRFSDQQEKKIITKKQMVIRSMIGAVLVILVGFSLWASNYYSEKSTIKRYTEALSEEKVDRLIDLTVHEDGSSIKKGEAKALLALVKKEGKDIIDPLTSIEPSGKFLGVFQQYRFKLKDQFVYTGEIIEGLHFEFNQMEVPIKEDSEGVIFGPLTPGIYTVSTNLNNDFGKSSSKQELYLTSDMSNPSFLESNLPVSHAVIAVENYDAKMMKDIQIVINNNSYSVNENGITEPFGPLILDGYIKAKIIAQFPWGESTTEAFPIDRDYIEVKVAPVSGKQREIISSTLLSLGEEIANAKASKTTTVLTTASTNFKKDFQEGEIDYLIDDQRYYKGKLNQLDINWNSLGLIENETIISLDIAYSFDESLYSLEEVPSLENKIYPQKVYLSYDSKEQKWNVHSLENTWSEIISTETLLGSETIYEPNKEMFQTEKLASVKEELQDFMEDYAYYGVAAINNRNIEFVEDYLSKDGPKLQESIDYIFELEKKGIKEDYISSVVTNVVDKGDNTYEVTTTEAFTIYYPDSQQDKKYNTVTLVKKVDNRWLVHQLVSTKEI